MTVRSRWIDRLAGASLGALVTAWVLGRSAPEPAAVEPAADTPVEPAPEAPVEPAADTPVEPAPEAPVEPDAPKHAPRAPVEAKAAHAEPVAPEPEAPDASQTATRDAAAEATALGPAPKIPLPRLPGTNTLRTSSRFDPELSAWVLTHSLRVPAKAGQVESFYRKALADLGLQVSAFVEPVTDEWAVRVTVRGRGRKDKVQISIRQPAGEMRTTARIIWERAT